MLEPILTDIPLLLLHEEPLVIYVVNNTILGCEAPHNWCYYGSHRLLSLLAELFSFHNFRGELGNTLTDFFKSIKLDESSIFNFVIGATGFYGFPSLDFQISTSNDLQKPILFHSFQLNSHPLDYTINLSAEEAFIILANLCVTFRRDRFDFEPQTGKILSPPYSPDETIDFMDQFTLLYLNYILEKINRKEVSINQLISLNGVGLLTFFYYHPFVQDYLIEIFPSLGNISLLTPNQRILIYSFLKLNEEKIVNDNFPQIFRKIIAKIDFIINKLDSLLFKPFEGK
ncbi:MAG: hypothetical protein ACFFDW_06800 [Candidatus Thorarchaeota archaeon]